MVVCTNAPEQNLQALSAADVVIRQITPEPGSTRPSLSQILGTLGEMKITSVMLEAGSELNASFLSAGLVDRLYLFYAPTFLGPEAQPFASQALEKKRLTIQSTTLQQFGSDFAIEAPLKDPWQS